MRIELRNRQRQRLYTIEVDIKNPPTVVKPPHHADSAGTAGSAIFGASGASGASGGGSEVFLQWDQAVDDTGLLRRCPACGCRDLYVRKNFPQITGLALLVLAAMIAVLLYGVINEIMPGLIVLGLVIIIDILIYFYSSRSLVCYQCLSEFHELKIHHDHPGWEPTIAERYRQAAAHAKAHKSNPPSNELPPRSGSDHIA